MIIFLQNAWSPVYAGTVWPRPSWLRALARSRSGRKLRMLVDDLTCVHNASPLCGATADSVNLPNEQHVLAILESTKPRVVVACGKYAESALADLWAGPLLCIPHPAHRLVTNELYERAKRMLDEGFACRYALRQKRAGVAVEVLR